MTDGQRPDPILTCDDLLLCTARLMLRQLKHEMQNALCEQVFNGPPRWWTNSLTRMRMARTNEIIERSIPLIDHYQRLIRKHEGR